MTTDQDILAHAHGVWATKGSWFEREAARAIRHGLYRLIHGRNDNDVYVVRCWMSKPALDADGDFDSGDSVLLHYFPRADDDACLHDHPWDFRTTILEGGYVENLPPQHWVTNSQLGPEWDQNTDWHLRDKTLEHKAEDLHCVSRVLFGTWTLVRTGPRRRPWGFHPPGQLWQPWRQYINNLTKKVEA